MKHCVVSVRAVPAGWVVSAEPQLEPLMFSSGAQAEREAYRLGKALARAGCKVELSVHDRRDELLAHISLAPDPLVERRPPPPPRTWREPTPQPPGAAANRGHLRLVAAAGLALV